MRKTSIECKGNEHTPCPKHMSIKKAINIHKSLILGFQDSIDNPHPEMDDVWHLEERISGLEIGIAAIKTFEWMKTKQGYIKGHAVYMPPSFTQEEVEAKFNSFL